MAALAACSAGEGKGGTATRESTAATVSGTAGGGSAGAAGAGASSAAGRSVNSTGEPTVVFMGTSLTAGYGLADPQQAYPALLARRADSLGLGVRVVNAGLSGETSAGARRRVDWVLRGRVDAFVLETGANDGLRALDVEATRENIVATIRRVRAMRPDARVYLVQMEAPPNLGAGYTGRFRAIYPAIAKAEGVTLLPFLLEEVAGRAALNQPDGVHPTAEGARRVANTLWPALEPLFRELDGSRGRA